MQRESELRAACNTNFVERVRRIIQTMLDHEGCTADTVGHELSLPAKNLRYSLQQKSTSYHGIFNEAQLELASHYLLHSELGITAIGEPLRFNVTAAFSNFFKQPIDASPRNFSNGTL